MTKQKTFNRKPYAGNPSVQSVEGKSSSAAKTERGAQLRKDAEEMRGMFINLGKNMVSDVRMSEWSLEKQLNFCEVFNDEVWWRITEHMAKRGFNTVVLDLCEGCVYPSHPYLAAKGAWSADKIRKELVRLRNMGLEPIPKLNFSTTHDAWLKEYGRMVSTAEYYKVCSDLIRDVCDMFDGPRLFHLGYDEENYPNQRTWACCVIRQGDLWWHDFFFFVDAVEKLGMRPWIWSDYIWGHENEFLAKMPKSVMQSNWYYRQWFDLSTIPKGRRVHLESFLTLEKAGFEQIPCGSNWACDENIAGLVKFCRKHIAPERLKGFLMTTWAATTPDNEAKIMRGIDLAADSWKS